MATEAFEGTMSVTPAMRATASVSHPAVYAGSGRRVDPSPATMVIALSPSGSNTISLTLRLTE